MLSCSSDSIAGGGGDDLKGKKADCGLCNFDDNPNCVGRETIENCPDCGVNTIQNSLYLLSYSTQNDVKGGSGAQADYQEGWLRNRYELSLQTLLYRQFAPDPDPTVPLSYFYVTGSRSSNSTWDTDVNPRGIELEVSQKEHLLKLLKVGRGDLNTYY